MYLTVLIKTSTSITYHLLLAVKQIVAQNQLNASRLDIINLQASPRRTISNTSLENQPMEASKL